MPEINENTEYTGPLLKQVREARKLTLEKLSDITKISIYYLRMLEGDHFEDLPALVYVKGYLRHLAKLLGLNAQALVDSYIKRMEPPPGKK
jgi:flagellar biosynthesis protein FlhG